MQKQGLPLLIVLVITCIVLFIPMREVARDNTKETICDFEVGYDGAKCHEVNKPQPISIQMQCNMTGQSIQIK